MNRWSGRMGFIFTATAFAVGLGNVWRFPYLAGQHGGGAFLLMYLMLVVLVGIPILLTEIGLGRMSQNGPLLGFGKLAKIKQYNFIGWLELILAILIMGYYIMVMAWIAMYMWACMQGNFGGLNQDGIVQQFNQISGNSWVVVLMAYLLTFLAVLIVRRGLVNGVEKSAKILMPLLLVIMLISTAWAWTLDGASKGLNWFLMPDFEQLSWQAVLQGVGQLFFSIGAGLASAFAFGSYTAQSENIVRSSFIIVMADTFFAVLAGLMIFPALFSFDIPLDSGPSMIFLTMTQLFAQMPAGALFGTLFFFLLLIAGFSSQIAILETLARSLSEHYKLSVNQSLIWVVGLVCLLAIPNILSFATDPFNIGAWSFFDIMDFLTNTILLPLVGLLIMLFGAYIVGFRNLKAHLQKGAGGFEIPSFWKPVIKILIPALLIWVLINGLL